MHIYIYNNVLVLGFAVLLEFTAPWALAGGPFAHKGRPLALRVGPWPLGPRIHLMDRSLLVII